MYKEIKEFYKEKFGIEPKLVDIMSDINILKLSVSGTSNYEIGTFLDMYVNDVYKTIQKYFKPFTGWDSSLSFSPIVLYRRFIEEGIEQRNFIDIFVKYGYSELVGVTAWEVCSEYERLEAMINEKWI